MAMTDHEFIRFNGTDATIETDESVMSFVKRSGFDPARIAVEINGAICPRAEYQTTVLRKGDVMEVVSFVGGG